MSILPYVRTTGCGEITDAFVGQVVDLSGWVHRRRDHGGLTFIDLRDRTGFMQLVFNAENNKDAHEIAHSVRSEYVISVNGIVVYRSPETVNRDLSTGMFELHVHKITILNRATSLPFQLDEAAEVDEETRVRYRYLDLRRPEMHDSLALRHKIIFAMREFLHSEKFYEIETPILTKVTPEGARGFLVPSRHEVGHWYALAQSPQLYKQLLMAGGFERYFQVARCFRDEDTRLDRQPEFTQLDLEMSFITEIDIQGIIERLLEKIFSTVLGKKITLPLKRITHDEAFHRYGSDKPDLRFELPIVEVTSIFEDTALSFLKALLQKGGRIGALHIAQQSQSRSELDGWVTWATAAGASGLIWIKIGADNQLEAPVAKYFPPDFFERLRTFFPSLSSGDLLFLIAGHYESTWTLLGRLRTALATRFSLIDHNKTSLFWVTDFPMFEKNATGGWSARHHPFTAPQAGWEEQPLEAVKARAYDIVYNGFEIGGGSIRIHTPELQQKVLSVIGLTPEQAQQKFGFLLEAQKLGFPPHGGIALGIDRLIMLVRNVSSIREVIAFPKTARGHDPLMDSPTPVEQTMLREYGVRMAADATKKQ